MDNRTVARWLTDYADFLETKDANVYRVRAYRRAAERVVALDEPLADLVARRGRDGLEELDGIGPHLSYTIEALVRTGEFRTIHGEGGHIDIEQVFASLPGVGPRLARRIRQQLGIQTLQQLEQAAHEGRLRDVQLGPKRTRALIDALAGRSRYRRWLEAPPGEPAIRDLLAIDEEYRHLAAKGELPTFAPRRFNPDHEPWLPFFQRDRDGWHYRAFYSNTALAHRLRQTHDWVVIYFDDGVASGQRTVVTEVRGSLRGRRVVRGREAECRAYYQPSEPRPAAAG